MKRVVIQWTKTAFSDSTKDDEGGEEERLADEE